MSSVQAAKDNTSVPLTVRDGHRNLNTVERKWFSTLFHEVFELAHLEVGCLSGISANRAKRPAEPRWIRRCGQLRLTKLTTCYGRFRFLRVISARPSRRCVALNGGKESARARLRRIIEEIALRSATTVLGRQGCKGTMSIALNREMTRGPINGEWIFRSTRTREHSNVRETMDEPLSHTVAVEIYRSVMGRVPTTGTYSAAAYCNPRSQ